MTSKIFSHFIGIRIASPKASDDSGNGQGRLFRNSKSKILMGLELPVASGMKWELGWAWRKKVVSKIIWFGCGMKSARTSATQCSYDK